MNEYEYEYRIVSTQTGDSTTYHLLELTHKRLLHGNNNSEIGNILSQADFETPIN